MNKKIMAAGLVMVFLLSLIIGLKNYLAMSPENTKGLPKLAEPHLVVNKGERQLQLFDGEKLIKSYPIVLGFTPVGDKEKSGDGKTPEGEFYIFVKNDKSKFYLSLGVSYPNAEDARRGLAEKLITPAEHDAILKAVEERKMPPQNTALGGEIYIHGGGTAKDWTWGCLALENEQMKELYDAVPVGAKIEIRP